MIAGVAITLRRTLMLILLALMLAAGAAGLAYQRDMRAIHARLADGAGVVETALGPVAFETDGDGVPVLAIHGAGGGHDQGRLLAEGFLPEGYRWIAPSRFGYPGASLPADASTAAQADAFVGLRSASFHRSARIVRRPDMVCSNVSVRVGLMSRIFLGPRSRTPRKSWCFCYISPCSSKLPWFRHGSGKSET